MLGFFCYWLSGECPGEAAHPLLMGVFPLGGCLSVVARGIPGPAAPLPCIPPGGSLCSTTCRCSPIPSDTALGVLGGGSVLLPAVRLFPKFHPAGLEQVNPWCSGGVGWG